jgi:hypothetical protein
MIPTILHLKKDMDTTTSRGLKNSTRITLKGTILRHVITKLPKATKLFSVKGKRSDSSCTREGPLDYQIK